MKITFILPGYPWKPIGGFRLVYEFANQLVARGHKITIIHPRRLNNVIYRPPNFYHWLRRKGGYLRDLFIRPKVKWQAIDKRIKMLYVPEPITRNIPNADVVFATAWQTTEYIIKYPLSKGEKFYIVMDFDHYFGSQERLEASWKLPFKKAAISHWLYKKVVSITKTENDIINVSLGIDHSKFRRTQNIDNRPKRIAMMYSPVSYKGIEDGIKAIEISKRRHPDLKVTIFGARETRPPQVQSWIEYKCCNAAQAELVNIYNQSRIFVCSSLAEGFAIPPAEAMACGCAVVSTDCGGNREYAEDGVTALLSPPKNPESLAKNIIKLLEDDGLRIKIAKAGYERIQKFTWERSTDILEKFILNNIKR